MRFKDSIAHLPPYKPAKLVRQLPPDVVKLSSNENALGASPRALAALQAALPRIYRYPDAGAVALRRALAAHVAVDPEMVICGNGTDELIFLLCVGFLSEGDEVVMAHGSFISYYLRTLEMSARPVRVPLRESTHDLVAMADAVNDRTQLLFLCNPNNPTGTTNGAAEVAQLLDRVPNHVLVVVDEAYLEFATRDDYPQLIDDVRRRTNVILLRTFSKIYGLAGLRIGYAIGSPEVIGYLDRVRPVFNCNALAQVAACAALEDEEHLARSRAHAVANRASFRRELLALGLTPVPSETNFVAVHVGDDAAVSDALLERGFTVTPLAGWGLPGYIRISFGMDAENARFFDVLRAILVP